MHKYKIHEFRSMNLRIKIQCKKNIIVKIIIIIIIIIIMIIIIINNNNNNNMTNKEFVTIRTAYIAPCMAAENFTIYAVLFSIIYTHLYNLWIYQLSYLVLRKYTSILH